MKFNRKSSLRASLVIASLVSLAACSSIDLTENASGAGVSGSGASASSGDALSSATTEGTAGQNAINTVDLTAEKGQVDAVSGLDKVLYFDFDSYVLKEEYANLIAQHAQALAGNNKLRVSLAGHTDELGSREYNLALGQQRAEAVRRALTLLGASDNQIEAVSFGEEKPASLGGDAQSRALNRRVEISYR
jgi:peptidoglycan-associated lipoprotein